MSWLAIDRRLTSFDCLELDVVFKLMTESSYQIGYQLSTASSQYVLILLSNCRSSIGSKAVQFSNELDSSTFQIDS